MPTYQYLCDARGPCEEVAPSSRFAEPCDCPACGAASPRNLLSLPQLSRLNSVARSGHAINERASDSPRRAKANGLTSTGPKIRSKARQHADGSRSISGARPWMLSR